MPDNRAEVDTPQEISLLLGSAYSNKAPVLIMEYSTDNVMDNGILYEVYGGNISAEAYLREPIISTGNDDVTYLWRANYTAILSANQALNVIEAQGNPAELSAYRAEALLCRAYAHFTLANLFCLPYNSETATTDLGLPYITQLETKPKVDHVRGNMADFYAKIDADIEAALPYVVDRGLATKYHFSRKSAYAFAARFNLYYMKPDKSNLTKVIEYATQAIGTDPSGVLRNMFGTYAPLGAADIENQYAQSSEAANLLIQPLYSIAGRVITHSGRYGQSRPIITYETYWAEGPWGKVGTESYIVSPLYVGGAGDKAIRFPRLDEWWEYTDKTGGSGYAHVVYIPFTTDETLLCRAEAYALLGNYEQAATDLNYWQTAYCKPTIGNNPLPKLTRTRINDFWSKMKYCPTVSVTENGSDRTPKKELHPHGFTVQAGEQENFIQCVLHFRRITTIHDGMRWCDIKRYGIEIGHNRYGLPADILTKDDPRRAIQLPADVLTAGLEANPGEKASDTRVSPEMEDLAKTALRR
jgi:hypothetical protein